MAINRNTDWTLNIIKCMWYCQNNSEKICWKWCRNKQQNKISNELFFSDEKLINHLDVKSNEIYFKEKIESILKNIY